MPDRRSPLDRRSSLAVIVVAVLVGLLSLVLHAWAGLESGTIDARFALRGTRRAPGIVVVGIDDATFSALGLQWPFPRSLDARVIDHLHADGARVIAFDVQFTEPSHSARDDLELYDAIKRAGDVVLADTEVNRRGQTAVFGSEANVRAAHAVVGMANMPADGDGRIRRYRAVVLGHPSFAAATARMAGMPVRRDAFGSDGALIDFRGAPGTIREVPFSSVLRGTVDPATFAGKIVVIGATSPTLQDLHATATTSATPMSGAELQANAIWTALHGNPLRPAPGWLAVIAVIVCALVTPLGARRRSVIVAGGAGLATLGLYVLVAQIAFDSGHVLMVCAPLSAGLVALAGTVLAGYATALRDRAAFRRRLLDSQQEMVERLAQAIESRHAETGEHTQRIGRLCRTLARALGWSDADADTLMRAAVAHDIGKIGIGDDLLLREGPLTLQERAHMQTHTEIGARLLSGSESPLLQMAERIALTHHERWDGQGYPRGLRGEEIPVEGRICAVVDVFDALLSARAYKPAWSMQATLEELRGGRGTQFDPTVLDAFLELVPSLGAESGVPAPSGRSSDQPVASATKAAIEAVNARRLSSQA